MPWALPKEREEMLTLAKGYPYPAPPESFLFAGGEVREVSGADFAGRVPVIAHGSNRSPEQLQRKYGHLPGHHAEIPVTFAWIADYDVVYAAHVTRYGALAATMAHVPGCSVRVAITWLDDAQLERMHETEGGHYTYGALDDIEIELEAGPAGGIHRAWLYLSRFGSLGHEGGHVGLAALRAENRPHPELGQEEALDLIRRRYRPEEALDDFVLANIGDAKERKRHRLDIVHRIRETAMPMNAPHFNVELEEAPGPV